MSDPGRMLYRETLRDRAPLPWFCAGTPGEKAGYIRGVDTGREMLLIWTTGSGVLNGMVNRNGKEQPLQVRFFGKLVV